MSVTGIDLRADEKVKSSNADTDEARSVTAPDSARGSLVKSRNLHRLDWRLLNAARQEAAEQVAKAREEVGEGADFFAFLDALCRHDVPEEQEALRRVEEAQRSAELCGQCGRHLEDGEAVYLAPKVYVGMAALVRQPNFHRGPVCGACAPMDITERANTRVTVAYYLLVDEPCGACGRPVVLRTTRGLYNRRRDVFCCERCRWTYHNGLRKERNAWAREKVCEGCGEPFTATRRDAKTCSAVCKQKVYRLRKKGSA